MIPEWAAPLVQDVARAAVVFLVVAFVGVCTMLAGTVREHRRERRKLLYTNPRERRDTA
jgi:hypothetical protein